MCFCSQIRTLQHLPGADARGSRAIGFDIRHGTGLPAPGMVNQQFSIDAEQLVEQIFIVKLARLADRAAGNIAHGV